jgi:hypothetical protein
MVQFSRITSLSFCHAHRLHHITAQCQHTYELLNKKDVFGFLYCFVSFVPFCKKNRQFFHHPRRVTCDDLTTLPPRAKLLPRWARPEGPPGKEKMKKTVVSQKTGARNQKLIIPPNGQWTKIKPIQGNSK